MLPSLAAVSRPAAHQAASPLAVGRSTHYGPTPAPVPTLRCLWPLCILNIQKSHPQKEATTPTLRGGWRITCIGRHQSPSCPSLPRTHIPLHDSKKRMRVWRRDVLPLYQSLWGSHRQFLSQVSPLKQQLALGFFNRTNRRRMPDSGNVEAVSPALGLCQYSHQIAGDSPMRIRLCQKPQYLRVMAIPPGLTAQNGLRQQSLPPQCNQSLGIEVSGMERPKPHNNPLWWRRHPARSQNSRSQGR